MMAKIIWYVGLLLLGALAGSHSGFWGGLGVLIIGIPAYFMTPARFRAKISERDLVLGAILVFVISAAYYPIALTLLSGGNS